MFNDIGLFVDGIIKLAGCLFVAASLFAMTTVVFFVLWLVK